MADEKEKRTLLSDIKTNIIDKIGMFLIKTLWKGHMFIHPFPT